MAVDSHSALVDTSPIRAQCPDDTSLSPSHSTEYDFDESQCLFCNQTTSDLDQNLLHMSKAHGLHIETSNLVVEIASLLAYFHLIISECYECLYCGTQRNTRQAVQQHMMDKGHCKYNITDDDADLRDFYEFPSSDARDDLTSRFSDHPQLPQQARLRKPRPSKGPNRQEVDISASPFNPPSPTSTPHSSTNSSPRSNSAEPPSSNPLNALSTRALKQEHTLNNQLAQLRAEDRRSLAHLPTSQQRALLATHHKQTENARRTEQTQRGHLESAGNHFGRLSTIKLIRKPPHTGNVCSLNR